MIPRPSHQRSSGSDARLDGRTVLVADAGVRDVAELLSAELEESTGWLLPVRAGHETTPAPLGAVGQDPEPGSSAGTPRITLRVDAGSFAHGASHEAYRLQVSATGVDIVGAGAAGVFYGTRTLRQLLPPALLRRAPVPAPAEAAVPGVVIDDSPRFSWRGMHLDVARHFMPKHWVLRLVDLAALHKLNVLHLHLTDDQGWRVPIDRYPRLVEVGAWRRESMAGHHMEGRYDGTPHGGHYSKADLHEIVAYAARRFVTVVPEIDMPGHMQAAIAAYPELGNTDTQLEVFTSWGISDHVLNLEEPTIRFCTEVLEEVLDIFPCRAVHVGGDECPTAEWEKSTLAQRRMVELGLPDARSLQGWFTGRMAGFLAGRGRTLVGWDEIVDAGAPPGAIVMVWRHPRVGAAAAEAGHDVVMAPMQFLYFDWAYAADPREPLAIGAAISTERVYSYEPVPRRLAPEHHAHVLGAQCQLWTEYVSDPMHAEYLYFPRACAFAEVVWSPPERDWIEFRRRLPVHLERLDALAVNYRPLEGPTPAQARTWET